MWGRAQVVAVSISPQGFVSPRDALQMRFLIEVCLQNGYGMRNGGALYLEQCVRALVRCISSSVLAQ